ncbi:two-component system, NtrC family, nitrogen regulation sensor histidine kinase NtrY [Palleronia salina]|uniref:histidine kinase n=1 Tax=Palleronia salina TaxID=313368 RepID=A0A1M6B3B8_9RHOB|nr:PAS domain-containing sensor histidine kinase [Palleronia salina]SHI43239.1 two-component system, NtrC family, nitrogen regulation sensor histidine kinase NtrY [Palleronia salina]
MAHPARMLNWDTLARLRRQRRVRNAATVGLVILGPFLALATYLVLGPLNQGQSSLSLRLVILADLVYVIALATLVLSSVARVVAARRAQSAGSRLHLRLTRVFALLALVPTVTVAVFAALTINFGLEGWFSERVSRVVGASLEAAEAYEEEQRRDLSTDAEALANFLESARTNSFLLSDGELRQLLSQGQSQIQRGLREAYVINGAGEIQARGERSYLFDYERPDAAALEQALRGDTVVIEDWDINEFRALVKLEGLGDRFLYVSRAVDGELLALLDDTQDSVRLYNQLESERGRILFEFGLLYLGFAVILILAAIWLGLWFAERLSRPVGRLAGAAQRVGGGDLDVRVREEEGDDEISMLGRIFNQMTAQLKAQRASLLATTDQIERRRRLFDSVLGSVTSGVVGLDPDGRVTFVNRSAERLLQLDEGAGQSVPLSVAVPEFGTMFDKLKAGRGDVLQGEVKVSRGGALESLLVRMATRTAEDGTLEGYVVAFDDVSDLVAAQRMAAWGDVARRIAHEIKNPLTPIQLSAGRIRRKFSAEVEDAEALATMTDVIVRQTEGLRRIVDEFSQFARMPTPERRRHDLTALVRDAVSLQQAGQEGVTITADLPDGPVKAELDEDMIGQALTNLIKNAGEATQTLAQRGAPEGWSPEIRVEMQSENDGVVIGISDNGVGLPEDRARLFEPYVTTREEGTGLGLPIVKKIIEEHGGTLTLSDAAAFDDTGHHGARAEIRLPVESEADTGRADADALKKLAEEDAE